MIILSLCRPQAFEMLSKRKPAPRLFCDICDEFDKHETEDCPLQAGDERDYSPPPAEANNNEKKERKLPAPRKYCDSCEGKPSIPKSTLIYVHVFKCIPFSFSFWTWYERMRWRWDLLEH